MSEAVWSIIKYKPKAGCEDEFKKDGLTRLAEMMEKYSATWSLIELEEMIPWERDIYVSLLMQWIEEENERQKEEERKLRY